MPKLNQRGLVELRRELERRLVELLGKPVHVMQLTIFALPCGCVGASLEVRNIVREDAEVFRDHLRDLLREMVKWTLGKEPDLYYARLTPSGYDVVSLTGRVACDECEKNFKGAADVLPL
ncbi:DUF5402 family protein [Methanopyrus kandleri]|uniref:Predicted metal-binding protein n=2 Tax=Methanopyrus kandleri TaxID=2320 RepID=Q8TZB5_METKA|nr:DUF5402 family protein [Methanopyrus kandleri]AAM01237.1 Predicted metal-binding protein [Methanopyrus kandleri AV19]HII70843.1 DUF5402 family protein [Methanopyrus kandleri]